jgi:ABC-type sugar transport system substrate-binding protein
MSYWKCVAVTLCSILFILSCSGKKESGKLQEAERPRFVFITNGNSPFFDAAHKGLQDAAKEFNVEVEMIRKTCLPEARSVVWNRWSTAGCQGVMVSVVEPNASGIIDQDEAPRAKGIPVLTLMLMAKETS